MPHTHIVLELAPSLIVLYLIERFFETLVVDRTKMPETMRLRALGSLMVFASMMSRDLAAQQDGQVGRVYRMITSSPLVCGIQPDAAMIRQLLYLAMQRVLMLEYIAMLHDNLDDDLLDEIERKADDQSHCVEMVLRECELDFLTIWHSTFGRIRLQA